ncbi:uncharacterized protein LOC113333589 [Papaver somniferum]|uniref:uncharacterized protein LOC113333589 n=1 Tax=Papaver somniferum TaxID=3469 RepID=UPI000E6FC46A|nr:uncharacterized protein LOC113333589 [Papaver somniferum]
MKWLQIFSDWGYKVGLRVASDHFPLLGGCASVPKPKNVPLRFQKIWLEHSSFMSVVQDSLAIQIHGDAPYIFMQKRKHLKQILKDWNWRAFGDVKVKIQEAEKNFKDKMEISNKNPHDEQALHDLVTAQNDLNSRETHYSTMMKQKSRVKWVMEGSANTNFFHSNIKIKQTRNDICELEDENDNLISDQTKIADILVDFFEKRFQEQAVEISEDILDVITNIITESDQFMLEVTPEADEIKVVVFAMDGDNAPGPDSSSRMFYKACWEIIQHDFINVVQYCWKRKYIPKGLNSKFLVILPKVQGAKKPNQFRPISLSNFSYKVFTKIISLRMASLMNKLVSPQQVAYIKGINIHEKIFLASELVNEMKKKRRGGNLSLKLDISEAYDSVSWLFLFKVLQKYGFFVAWCDWLKVLLSSAKISVMVNGGPNGFFSMNRGLKQGDPLSQIIFVLMEEVLSKGLTKMVETKKIQSMVIRKGIAPKHLLFADDIFLFSNDSKKRMMWKLKTSKEEWSLFFAAKFQDKNGQWTSQWKLSSVWPGFKWDWQSLKNDVRWIIGKGDNISVWFDTWTGEGPLIDRIGFTDHVKNNFQMKVKDLLQNNEWVIPIEL